jgi:hypothetical protein
MTPAVIVAATASAADMVIIARRMVLSPLRHGFRGRASSRCAERKRTTDVQPHIGGTTDDHKSGFKELFR